MNDVDLFLGVLAVVFFVLFPLSPFVLIATMMISTSAAIEENTTYDSAFATAATISPETAPAPARNAAAVSVLRRQLYSLNGSSPRASWRSRVRDGRMILEARFNNAHGASDGRTVYRRENYGREKSHANAEDAAPWVRERHNSAMTAMNDPISRALLALDGLSVGDAFGQRFFSPHEVITSDRISRNDAPAPPWLHTDDTEMAIGIVQVLRRHGRIEQEDLARTFARRYMTDPDRGYGGGAKRILADIYCGMSWREASATAFDGRGSMGNGSAMRVAPLGAFFADDVPTLIEEAHRSAAVTHFHPEASAGAIAVALAAAFAWNHRAQSLDAAPGQLLEFVYDLTPPGQTREGISAAMKLPPSAPVKEAVRVLGNGSQILCHDTVPLCLWLAARNLGNYSQAVWTTASAGGDIDTNCAIVGGIVALASGMEAIPPTWLAARGPLRIERA